MYELLRPLWAEPRPPRAPGRTRWDWMLVGMLIPVAIVEGVLRPDMPWRALSVIVAIAIVPTLLWRRTRPLLMVAIAFGTSTLVSLLVGGDLQLRTLVFLLLLPYSLFRWGSGREIVGGLVIIFGNVGLSAAIGHIRPADAIGSLAVLLATFAVGTALRYRARARAREIDQAKLRERERLARDLHDIVAHHVSAIAIRAQAGMAASNSRPDAGVDALRIIEAEASRALTEMRTMVRALRRDEPADLAPSPGIREIEGLAGRDRGLDVDVKIHGDLDDIPSPVSTAIYRLAQESVTNARRHARHATRIEIQVTADDQSVHLRVNDDGAPTSIRPTVPGYGLIGMRERAGLLGGTCRAGADPGRGWTVTATLPRTGPLA